MELNKDILKSIPYNTKYNLEKSIKELITSIIKKGIVGLYIGNLEVAENSIYCNKKELELIAEYFKNRGYFISKYKANIERKIVTYIKIKYYPK